MTWSAVITDQNGNRGPNSWHVCPECAHTGGCHIPAASSGLANVLTAIDRGQDNIPRSGTMQLYCAGFEQKEAA